MIFWLQWQVFLKVTNRPVGWGEPPVGHRRCRVLLGPSLIIIRVKQILNLPALSDPAYWSTALSYEAPGIISKVISQVLVASQSQQSLQELWRAQLIFWQCWTWNSFLRFPSRLDMTDMTDLLAEVRWTRYQCSDYPLFGETPGPSN